MRRPDTPSTPLRRRGALAGFACAMLAGAVPASAADPAGGDVPTRPIFLDIDRIVITIFRGDDVARHEMIAMKLELTDDTAIPTVQAAMPRLRDAFIRSWNALGSQPGAADSGLNVAAGRSRMLAACDQIVGRGLVRNVLIVAQSSRTVPPTRSRP